MASAGKFVPWCVPGIGTDNVGPCFNNFARDAWPYCSKLQAWSCCRRHSHDLSNVFCAKKMCKKMSFISNVLFSNSTQCKEKRTFDKSQSTKRKSASAFFKWFDSLYTKQNLTFFHIVKRIKWILRNTYTNQSYQKKTQQVQIFPSLTTEMTQSIEIL